MDFDQVMVCFVFSGLSVSDLFYKLRYFLEYGDVSCLKNCISVKFNLDYKLALKDLRDINMKNADLDRVREAYPVEILFDLIVVKIKELLYLDPKAFISFLKFIFKHLESCCEYDHFFYKNFFIIELWKMFIFVFKLSLNQKKLDKLKKDHPFVKERQKIIFLIARRILFLILLNPKIATKADKYGFFLTIFYTIKEPRDNRTNYCLKKFFDWWQSTEDFKKWKKSKKNK